MNVLVRIGQDDAFVFDFDRYEQFEVGFSPSHHKRIALPACLFYVFARVSAGLSSALARARLSARP